jgi:3-oxoacyl-[acyl-carrier protein] reductase
MYRINVFTPFLLTKYVIRNMILNRISGSIVHLSSISVHTGYKGLAMYASTKGALEGFSKGTSREWGEKGIRSNCLVAGFMETDMSSSLSLDQRNRIYKRTALKVPTSIYSVAEMIYFLVSDKAKSITGQNIFVDSGTL